MACAQILSGITVDCLPNIGGIRELYIANAADVTSFTADENGRINEITMASSKHFYRFQFKKNTANATSTINADANGTNVESIINLTFNRQDVDKRMAINALALSEMIVMAKLANGDVQFYGFDMPVTLNGGTGETGTAFTDANQYTVSLQDQSLELPHFVKTAPDSSSDTDYVDLETLLA